MKDYIINKEQPIVFLDIDGVLNSWEYLKGRDDNKIDTEDTFNWYLSDISPKNVDIFNRIIIETKADIVISSSWRHSRGDLVIDVLKEAGVLGKIVGFTPSLRCVRGQEILQWIEDFWQKFDDNNNYRPLDFTKYVILDDDSDMLLWQKDNFVQTNNEVGITEEDVEKAIRILT